MANCRYCTFARFEDGRPVACEMVRVLVAGEHNCIAFSREAGSDDDLGAQSTDPLPVPIPTHDPR